MMNHFAEGIIMRRLVGVAAVLLAAAMLPASPASATTFTVNSSGDAGDKNVGDGVCATVANVCTLRAAVQQANALPGTDLITVPAMTIALGSPLTLSSNITISGAGARATILSATGGAHLMITMTAGTATVGGLTVTGATGGGGTLAVQQIGGGLTLDKVRITDNNASGLGATYGPVYTQAGTLTIRDSEISGNSTTSTSGNAWERCRCGVCRHGHHHQLHAG